MPAEVGVAGFSLSFSLATALFGGFTPAVSTFLVSAMGDQASPAFWLMFAALCGLGATLVLYRRRQPRGVLEETPALR
jgi:MHS family citrate/tricarballylate:H+ symporter-like MFS transporter